MCICVECGGNFYYVKRGRSVVVWKLTEMDNTVSFNAERIPDLNYCFVYENHLMIYRRMNYYFVYCNQKNFKEESVPAVVRSTGK